MSVIYLSAINQNKVENKSARERQSVISKVCNFHQFKVFVVDYESWGDYYRAYDITLKQIKQSDVLKIPFNSLKNCKVK